MSASTRGTDPAKKEPAKSSKTREEQEAWNKAALAFAQYYHAKHHLAQWKMVSNPDDSSNYSAPDPKGPALSTGATLTKLLPDGLYVNRASQFMDAKTQQPVFSIEIHEGKAKPCGGPNAGLSEIDYLKDKKKYIQNFKMAYGEAMDLLASGKGFKEIDLDLGHVNVPPSQYDRLRLDMLLELAVEKGLGVNPGPGINNMIKQFPPFGSEPGRWEKIKGKLLARDVTNMGQAEFFRKLGNVNAHHQQALQTQLFELNKFEATLAGTEKLPGATDEDKKQNYKTSILKDPPGTEDEQVKALLEASSKLDARVNALEGAKRQIESEMKVLEARVGQAQTKGDIEVLEKDLMELQKSREKLLDSIDEERADTKLRHEALKEELAKPGRSQENVAKLQPAVDKQAERATKMDSTANVRNTVTDGLKKVEDEKKEKQDSVQEGPATPKRI